MSDLVQYAWKVGRGRKASAQALGEAAAKTAALHGAVAVPGVIAREARAKGHPFHDELEWDDKVAAHEHRTQQVRDIISEIVVLDDAGGRVPGPAFLHVKVEAGEGYMPRAKAMDVEETRIEILREAIRGLNGWVKRWEYLSSDYDEFEQATATIKETVEKLMANLGI